MIVVSEHRHHERTEIISPVNWTAICEALSDPGSGCSSNVTRDHKHWTLVERLFWNNRVHPVILNCFWPYLGRGLADTSGHQLGFRWRNSSNAYRRRSSGMSSWPHGRLGWWFAWAPCCCGTAELGRTPCRAAAYSVGSGWCVKTQECVTVLCMRRGKQKTGGIRWNYIFL